ncbi:MAG: chitobiase/beta-hexosaminidase C-terminal domain-containing protein, partial [Terracidiphilus sp.]
MRFCLKGIAALLMLGATCSAHAQTCSGMSLGANASLNGFVPYPSANAWNTNIASAAVDPNSAAIVAASGFAGLHLHHDFGSTATGYGIPYVVVDSTTTPAVPINVIDYASESDVAVAPYPANAPIEGAPADCTGWPDTYQGDAHVLVLDRAKCFLYETFNTNRCNGQYNASSETIWDMANYESRPWGWTSADAAGLSIFTGLVRYDEVAAGAIHHAIRFTMQNTKDDANDGYFVPPASHAAGTLWGVSNVEGMRIRLKASFDISSYSAANQVILTAMKDYGMILADNGGYFYFQGAPDPRWDDDDLTNLDSIGSENFDVVQMTPEFPGWDSAMAPTGALPVINSFTASASSVTSGSPVTFTYTATGDSYDYIDMIGPIAAGGASIIIHPTATQTYTLYSTNAYGQTASSPITVTVPGSVVAPPVFTPPAGSYAAAQTVTLSTATSPYAAIYYTTDGSTPTYPITGTTQAYPVTPTPPNSQGNVNSITVSATETVKAIARATGYAASSGVSSAAYVIGTPAAATPTFTPAGGVYTSVQSVTIATTTTSGSPAIYYTTDGSTPTYPITGTTKLYGGAITVSVSETVNAIAVATGFSNSAVGSAAYTIDLPTAATPTFNPPAGTYGSAQMVTIGTTTTTGSPAIYYTTDGSTPTYPITGTTKLYGGAIAVSVSETLNAIAEAAGYNNSAVGSAAYIVNLPFPGPTMVQQCSQAENFVESISCTLTGVGAGHTLVIGIAGSGVIQSATVASSSGTPILAVKDGSTLSAYILPDTTAGSITITVSIGASMDMWLNVFEYSKTAASPLDGTAFAVSAIWQPTSFSSPAFTTTDALDTLWSYCLAPGGYTLTAGTAPVTWTELPSQTTGYATLIEDAPTASAGSYYGECGTGGGAGIPEIITLALKPPPVLSQTITFPAIATPQDALTSVTLTATASSGLAVSYTSLTPAVCAVSASSASLIESGTCTLQATQAGNSDYLPAPAVDHSFWVSHIAQTITFPAITAAEVALTNMPLSATASSGLTVSFSSTTPTVCTVSGSNASLLTSGTCTILATQPGNIVYIAATSVYHGFWVSHTSQTITFPAITTAEVALTTMPLSATASSGLTVSFSSTTPTVCAVSGSSASLLTSGTCTILAKQPGNVVYTAATSVYHSFWVSHTSQTITFPAIPAQTALGSVTLKATSSSGLAVTYVSVTPTVCTVSASSASLLANGACTILAKQAGNIVYVAATSVAQSFT